MEQKTQNFRKTQHQTRGGAVEWITSRVSTMMVEDLEGLGGFEGELQNFNHPNIVLLWNPMKLLAKGRAQLLDLKPCTLLDLLIDFSENQSLIITVQYTWSLDWSECNRWQIITSLLSRYSMSKLNLLGNSWLSCTVLCRPPPSWPLALCWALLTLSRNVSLARSLWWPTERSLILQTRCWMLKTKPYSMVRHAISDNQSHRKKRLVKSW